MSYTDTRRMLDLEATVATLLEHHAETGGIRHPLAISNV